MRGLSDEAFREAFGTVPRMLRLRWPEPSAPAAAIAGIACQQPVEADMPTAGTIFHATKLPLIWFAAIHLIVTAKNGVVELGRRLGVKQPTAWARSWR